MSQNMANNLDKEDIIKKGAWELIIVPEDAHKE